MYTLNSLLKLHNKYYNVIFLYLIVRENNLVSMNVHFAHFGIITLIIIYLIQSTMNKVVVIVFNEKQSSTEL